MSMQTLLHPQIPSSSAPLLRTLRIDFRGLPLPAVLTLPLDAGGLVLFADAHAEGHLAPRNQYFTQTLANRGIAVLQVDILTEREEARSMISPELAPEASVLAGRVIAATEWLTAQAFLRHLCLGC